MRISGFDQAAIDVFNLRFGVVTISVIVVLAALVLRLWFLQVLNGPAYRIQSENNRIHLQKLPPFRGMIFDRNGDLLVNNRPSYGLYITPEDVQDSEQLIKSLKMLIDIDTGFVRHKLDSVPRRYTYAPILVKNGISREELAVLETNLFNLPGVMIQVKPQRNYIYGELASHIIGYLGEISERQLKSGMYPDNSPGDYIGKYGVEGIWQTALNGLSGGSQMEVDAAGRKLRVLSKQSPVPGRNISLTIDKELQMLAEKMMKDKKGAIVAMKPDNGEILAMASIPAFDPNLFIGGIGHAEWQRIGLGKDSPLQNRTVSGQYAPGSVFKIVVALAGLEEGVIEADEEIICPGSYTLGNRTYSCWLKGGHGSIGFHRAMRESCDVYFYKLGKRLGVEKIAYYARMCGLGKKTNFALKNEMPGLIPTNEWKLEKKGVPWQPGETVSMSIGQTFVLVTPIQATRLIAAIFNGGRIYEPKIIQRIGKKNKKVLGIEPALMGEIEADPKNLELIKKGLIAVVNEPHGTGSKAMVPGVIIAGKTGTAQVISLPRDRDEEIEEEIPLEHRDHAWFVCVAPVEDPQIAICVLVEHGGHGGSASAPIAAEMIKAYLE
ncbi:MAG: penicillin-binding protein 2 [Deltaproteobacteria bacterium]|nr:penicillin-binding protein 2 [Deltaproteobacteria bacterium]